MDVNEPPSTPGVAIDPEAPTTDDSLLCLVSSPSVDPDGDPVFYAFSWWVDGTEAGMVDAMVDASLLAPGQVWTCRVTPSDGELAGPAGEASVTISSPPEGMVPDFHLEDINLNSSRYGEMVSPRDYLEQVSGWYFSHAT